MYIEGGHRVRQINKQTNKQLEALREHAFRANHRAKVNTMT